MLVNKQHQDSNTTLASKRALVLYIQCAVQSGRVAAQIIDAPQHAAARHRPRHFARTARGCRKIYAVQTPW